MIILDAHCDTITKIMEENEGLYDNNCHLDIKRLKESESHVQFFAAFIDPEFCQAYAMKRAVQIIDRLYQEIEINKDAITLCLNYNDIEKTLNAGKTAAILSIEGGDALQGELSALRIFYRLGVRSICLTWNHRNEIADGVSDGISGGGLTPFGRKVIKEMNSLGMIVDVSHLSEKGFWDVIEVSEKPIIASHSNAKKICSHKRNLTDEQIIALKDKGGVMGINLYPEFLEDSGKASLVDIIKNIEHISALAGIECIGLGADLDGVECLPDGINGVEDVYKIFNELRKMNYSEEQIEAIAAKNFLRVIKAVL